MRKKIKNLKEGEIFEVTFPSGNKRHCTIINTAGLKAKEITLVGKGGEEMRKSTDDYVEVIGFGAVNIDLSKLQKK